MKVTLKDYPEKEFTPGIKILEVIEAVAPGGLAQTVLAKLNQKAVDLTTRLFKDSELEALGEDSELGLETLRHSTSHLMAQAVKRLFPDTLVAIGPSIENGFYYDFDRKEPFTPEDLEKIEKEMAKIIKEDHPFIRTEITRQEALKLFSQKGEVYKAELISEIPDETVSLYQSGDFLDLCTGPHLLSSGKARAFKLLSIAGAYWRGKESNPQLQRIYGTAFFSKQALAEYLAKLAEAEKRDHRKLGKLLDLYSIQDEAGSGLVFWHPNAARIRRTIEEFWYHEHYQRGYQVVYTPHIAKINLWQTSGHLDFYRENLYSPMDIDGQDYLIKPMNCPFHILIYKTKRRSYRELPLRLAEMGTVYRYERSGVLHGLVRVRGFTQDDAHIFCTPEQLKSEMLDCVELACFMLETFGFKEYDVYLATRPEEKFAGEIQDWEVAESTLKAALEEKGIQFAIDEGGAAFYGPKIDIKIKDSLGREWQGPTIQFDFNLARRFEITFVAPDGKEHPVYLVHRAVLGSLERFMGLLIEHYGGAFPLWLSPIQVRIIPITENQQPAAQELLNRLRAADFRAEADYRNEKMGFKIRQAQLEKIPYMVILGEREVESEQLAVRERKDGDLGKMNFAQFLEILQKREKEKC